jgi:hypothetical protein
MDFVILIYGKTLKNAHVFLSIHLGSFFNSCGSITSINLGKCRPHNRIQALQNWHFNSVMQMSIYILKISILVMQNNISVMQTA